MCAPLFHRLCAASLLIVPWLLASVALAATPAPPTAPATPRSAAPIDLTGHWVSIVTEAWRFRMVTPAKGDYASIPITKAGLDAADRWDPARDIAEGQPCKAWGGAALLNRPGRLRVSWQDDATLKVEMDNGQQTRLLHFGKGNPGPRSLQGYSTAEWIDVVRRPRVPQTSGPGMGTLKVTTTHLLPGYLRTNGVPHSENAVITEYWDLHVETDGKPWLIVSIEVVDPENLVEPYLTTPNFRQEPDDSKWSPEPCAID